MNGVIQAQNTCKNRFKEHKYHDIREHPKPHIKHDAQWWHHAVQYELEQLQSGRDLFPRSRSAKKTQTDTYIDSSPSLLPAGCLEWSLTAVVCQNMCLMAGHLCTEPEPEGGWEVGGEAF